MLKPVLIGALFALIPALLSTPRQQFALNPQLEWTGGGWAVTALDLARWGKVLYEGKAFDHSMMAAFLDGVPAKLGPESKYGLA